MNPDFNLHDKIYYKGEPGIVVGLLEGGIRVILKVGDANYTVSHDSTDLLTKKQKDHRDKIKAQNMALNGPIIAEAKVDAPTPITELVKAQAEAVDTVAKPTPAPAPVAAKPVAPTAPKAAAPVAAKPVAPTAPKAAAPVAKSPAKSVPSPVKPA